MMSLETKALTLYKVLAMSQALEHSSEPSQWYLILYPLTTNGAVTSR